MSREGGTSFHSALYRGELVHARHDAIAKRAFRYPVYMASLDLDELPALDRDLRLFSHRRANLFSFDERDYAATLSPSARETPNLISALIDRLAALREANGIAQPATTRLITNLRVAGYVFNPVSFFLDYNANGSLTSVIAEVNNTYGGRHRYVLGPSERIANGEAITSGAAIANGEAITNGATRRGRVGFRHVRELFVSPFLHGPARYDFWFDAPLDGERLSIEMHVEQAGTRTFTARFGGERAAMSDRTLAGAAIRYPLMTAQVIGLIHYEAFKMRFAGVPYRRPGADHRPLH